MMPSRLSVYVVAHQDDWQLFMDPSISADIIDPACKTIVIHTTSGDAGEGREFWEAREEGAISSLLFRCSNAPKAEVARKYLTMGNRNVYLAEIGNCRLYFLRLPDGGMNGDGFALYHFQSLSKIRLKRIPKITTVDGENEFGSFEEISRLIEAIVMGELTTNCLTGTGKTTLNFPEYDHALNPRDHDDHLNTALLLQNTGLYGEMKKYAFVHYDIQHASADLEGMELFWKVGMFCVYHQTVMNIHGYSTIDESHQYSVWCRKKAIRREIV